MDRGPEWKEQRKGLPGSRDTQLCVSPGGSLCLVEDAGGFSCLSVPPTPRADFGNAFPGILATSGVSESRHYSQCKTLLKMTFQGMLICHPDNLRVSFKSPSAQDRILKAADSWDFVRQQVQEQARGKPSCSVPVVSVCPHYGKTLHPWHVREHS